jgi:hypothetical protein
MVRKLGMGRSGRNAILLQKFRSVVLREEIEQNISVKFDYVKVNLRDSCHVVKRPELLQVRSCS